ncbi:PIH1 domain-containing protein 1 [Nasonia vitripennis]|uniref:PIH1 domain-containing protein 1 n=1 Tax=Nasonia vitripennis TaxID=7425 RepID=A0A7M7GAW4_NASVI|nr:PIH1 domain-containing protein 1 [Nasonia vitripennis]
MMLNTGDRTGIEKRLKIVPDEANESDMPWYQAGMSNELPKKHKRVEPFPGVCIKTWLESGEKVFINVCHSKDICAPEDISDDKFAKELSEDVPGFVIPMAIGHEKMAKDKDDVERPTYDILINTSYFEKCMKKQHFWEFTILAILQSINDKFNKSIDTSKFVTLKNRKVMGSLDAFHIEDREPKKPTIKKALIQEIDIKDNSSLKQKPKIVETVQSKTQVENKQNPVSNKPKKISQNYVFVKADDQNSVIGFFYLPSSSITDLTVDVGDNRIIVENKKTDSMIDSYVPYSIDNTKVTADYDSKLHILRLTLPLRKN